MWRQVVSRSPLKPTAPSNAPDYVAAVDRLGRLVQSGKSHSGREANCCFLNLGNGKFADVSAVSGLNFIDDGRAVAVVDWDQDGDLDLWLANRTAPQLRFMRNNSSSANNFLALRLYDPSTLNLDAIGARVEVALKYPRGRKLVRTVRAGDSFLSQSSRWLHFGLGGVNQVQRVRVRWPGGDVEEFAAVQINARNVLVRRTGTAKPWQDLKRRVEFQPTVLRAGQPSQRRRIWLAGRVPMPTVRYVDTSGLRSDLVGLGPRPILVNLWSATCRPCLAELQEFSKYGAQLKRTRLEILALNVDRLQENDEVNLEQLRELLGRMQYPFSAGFADGETIHKLELMYSQMFGRDVSYPVPSSFLIDARGHLAVIYVGPLDVNRLLADVANLNVSDIKRRRLSTPLAGTWYQPPRGQDLSLIGREFRSHGYIEDAIPLLRKHLERNPDTVEVHHSLAIALVQTGRMEESEEHLRAALDLNPQFAFARIDIGNLLQQQGRLDEAIAMYREFLKFQPDHFPIRMSLAKALDSANQIEESLDIFRELVRVSPRHFSARLGLALALSKQGQFEEAIAECREAVWLNLARVEARYNLATMLMQFGDVDQAVRQYRRCLNSTGGNKEILNSLGVALLKQGNVEEAIAQHRRALEIDKTDEKSYCNLALALRKQGKTDEALDHYRTALRLKPGWPVAANSLAWVLATDLNENIRNGPEALRLAQAAIKQTGRDVPELLDTLAAACAEVGRYDEAAKNCQAAIQLLSRDEGRKTEVADFSARLKLYSQQMPYREAAD